MKAPSNPFPPRISPHAAEAECELRRHLRDHGLLRSPESAAYYDASRLGYLTAQIYPDAVRDRLLFVAAWYGTWTVFDDQLEKLPDSGDPAAVDAVASAMLSWLGPAANQPAQGPLNADNAVAVPFAAAFGEAWSRIREHSSPAWQARFVEHTRQYLSGCRWEADNRHRGTVPDLSSYVDKRRSFGAIRMAMDLSEFGGGYELAPHVHADGLVQELLDTLGDVALWANDLFSARVDGEEGNVSNLVFVLERHHGCGPAQAASMAHQMIEDRVGRLRQLMTQLPDWSAGRRLDAVQRAAVDRYAEGMRTLISGNVSWSTQNSRYQSARDRVSGSQPNFLLTAITPALISCAPWAPWSAGLAAL